jgi:hypothetical protein
MSARVPCAEPSLDVGFEIRQPYNAVTTEVEVRPNGIRRLPSVSSPTPKPNSDVLTQELLNRLFLWLGRDPEAGAQKYEAIRKRLIRVFICRGSNISEELADRTIDRVASKIPEIEADYSGDPTPYFLSAARYIFLESQRKERGSSVGMPAPAPPDTDEEQNYDDLQQCLAELSSEDRYLIQAYYQHDRHEKIEHRKKLAEEMGMGMNALRIRACRIRTSLLNSVKKVRAGESMKQDRP